MTTSANDNAPVGDLLLGAKPIAEFLGITPRQAYRLIADRVVPSFKAGGTVAARKSSLLAWMDAQERAA